MKKIHFALFFCGLTFLSLTNEVFAAKEFVSTYNVVYDVKESGTAHVTQNISISNTTSNYYISEYGLTISSTKIHNVYAKDQEGPLKTTVTQSENTTEIKSVFNQKIAGLGKTLNFLLSYDSDDIASHNGKIWEVNIPRLAKSDDMAGYSLMLNVPTSFGKPTYVYPQTNTDMLVFTKDQLEKSGITLTFGSYQVFSYQLKYHLVNPRRAKVFTEIALPPQTEYQEIRLENLTPKPNSVRIDEDGNWMAKYILEPEETATVIANGLVKLFLFPQSKETLSSTMKEKYLKPEKYWESNDFKIVELASKLKSPKNIYDYVVKTLSYDYKRLNTATERFGASKVLTMPTNAICMEFTDLFIALSRAAGIPARENDGFAYTTNDKLRPLSFVTDVLHSWPEYWDDGKKTWIQVDPTWENTTSGVDYFNKLDFNHFVFVTKGANSESPYPAGSYRQEQDKKDVIIDFGNDSDFLSSSPEVSIEIPQSAVSGLVITGNINIVNNGKTQTDEGILELKSTPLDILSGEKVKIPILPPLGKFTVPLQINNNKFSYSGINNISVEFQGKKAVKTIKISSLLPTLFILFGSILLLSSVIFFTAFLIHKRGIGKKNGQVTV